jgi:hypothetical protein
LIDELDAACKDAGRDRAEIEITAMWFPNPADLSDVERYSEMGVGRLVVPLPALGKGNPVENLKAFSENVLSKVA